MTKNTGVAANLVYASRNTSGWLHNGMVPTHNVYGLVAHLAVVTAMNVLTNDSGRVSKY